VEKLIYYNDLFLVATEMETNRVIGYIVGSYDQSYTHEFPGYIYVSRFAVKNKYRRRGVGTCLMMVLENSMLMTGRFKGVVADVRLSNTPSLTFFKNLGYTVSDTLSGKEMYKQGETPEERYKVVLYKKFPTINP
jgi:ribosomal protein S18 acetylase RimI-like enzyme